MRLTIAAIVLAASLPSKANTWGTDLSDLWYNASESGWGVNIVHQEKLLFLTFFLYGANGAPVWYSASDVQYTAKNAAGALIFSGSLLPNDWPLARGACIQPVTSELSPSRNRDSHRLRN
jgi:hypothetical protein